MVSIDDLYKEKNIKITKPEKTELNTENIIINADMLLKIMKPTDKKVIGTENDRKIYAIIDKEGKIE